MNKLKTKENKLLKSKVKKNGAKRIISLTLCGAMLALPLLFTSCAKDGQDGQNGKDGQDGAAGAKYYSGTANIETVTMGVLGDFYIDTDDYKLYQKTASGWTLVMDSFGKPGDTGVSSYTHIRYAKDALGTDISEDPTDRKYISIIITSSPESPAESAFTKWSKFVGDDGETPYIGYDGYFYYGKNKTEHQALNPLDDFTVENTVGLIGNEYFTESAVDMSEEQIALMSHYFSSIKKTAYSGASVNKITVYAKSAGTLTVSTASVKTIVKRTGKTEIPLSASVQFTLKEGLNTINLGGYAVADTDTIVLGAEGDTAKLAVYQGVANDDEQGLFARLGNRDLYSESSGINDKLALKVELTSSFTEHLELIKEEHIASFFKGKYVSILGDSISSYSGYSNSQSYNTNVSLDGPSCEYNGSKHGVLSVSETYWMSFINKMEMNFCVNNSIVADTVVKGYDRVSHLADNTVKNNPGAEVINPDFIIIFFGINDVRRSEAGTLEGIRADLITDNGDGTFSYKAPENFAEGYKIILDKASKLYGEDVKIACVTFPVHSFGTGEGSDPAHLEKYNSIIRALAEEYGAAVADLYEVKDYNTVYTDDDLHPTKEGMALIADYIEKAFKTIVED